ncbi:DNA polymerase-3 subunit epsilon [Paenimyroides ummariense]|uniref:DNA polymerase-3 subunit epsilon n=1 Tax=Paenimyroides ummariense TaxID=913024 RepID=A0A1I5GLL9_9FLAO|nr:hypothetical protein [Paenimyroides ummariense]SFO36756.1 DNA polymerase-3 subunit epsilon [Paenimyroides ummariense]
MALLLECSEIKKLWPIYNTALKRFEPKYGLYEYTARNGYRYLAVGKVSKLKPCIEVFSTINEGISLLRNLQEQFALDYRFCKYAVSTESEGVVVNDLSDLPLVEKHNQQVQQAVDFVTEMKPSYYILDKGRTKDEQSCIWVQDGHFYGMGYIANEVSVKDPEKMKDFLTRHKSNTYITQLISSFATKNSGKVFNIK